MTGLPAALDGLRIGLITDVHHSESVSAADVSLAVALLAEAKPDLTVLDPPGQNQGLERFGKVEF